MAEKLREKLHAACDECRTRKLKCSGHYPHCTRCDKEGIGCVYSPQKQMGRPRKRRREEAPAKEAASTDKVPQPSMIDLDEPAFSQARVFDDFRVLGAAEIADFAATSDAAGIPVTLSDQHIDPSLTSGYMSGITTDIDLAIDSAIDPSLWDAQPIGSERCLSSATTVTPSPCSPEQGTCTCLSTMYLALSALQTLSSFAFPTVVPVMRQAMHAAWCIIHCKQCRRDVFTTIQNVQSTSALLSAIGERFHRILQEIDEETERLEASGEKKPFRVGDNSLANAHLHTGTFDCPMGFDVNLEPREFRKLAKKALKTEVLGGGGNPVPFSSLLDQFEKRQNEWHHGDAHLEEGKKVFGENGTCKPGDAHCVRLVQTVRRIVDNMNWE
ncbi:hypothetical protein K491DRAFT_587528 [Lophiostoma macrostomum CBS 122681]|uniref:Zn(2)-C6 fungal-type domain-containing protein n=1 Tax=Lophiostoma macrostomum CBS 122681 TaxID=1314788 RepID=A0A6A6TNJ8_9PLEO|nr:hypothetical protein K491DRAFT_587528 [Lophiostoma macrostomum CBS 122681]